MRDIVLLKLAIIIEVHYSLSIVIKYSLLNKVKHPENIYSNVSLWVELWVKINQKPKSPFFIELNSS